MLGIRSAMPTPAYARLSSSAPRPPAPRATAAVAALPAMVTAGKRGKGVGARSAWIASLASPTIACITEATRKPAPIPEIAAHSTGSLQRATRFATRARVHATALPASGNSRARPSRIRTYCDEVSEAQIEDAKAERDVLAIAKTIAANEFPVERASVIGVDRESGRLLRLSPFPWKGNDTDPPLLRWSWIHARTLKDERDVRPETVNVEGEVTATAYVDAKDAWRLRWPFVRPNLHGSLESLQALARDRAATIGFVRPEPDGDVLHLPLRLRFRCASEDCVETHELPVLDWELHEMARLSRERYGP